MDFLQNTKQQLLFIYYANIQNKKKLTLLVSSLILLTLSTLAAVYSLNSKDAFTTFTDAKTTLSKDALLISQNTLISESKEIEMAPSPTPTIKDENIELLQRALETTWKRINSLPATPSKITLNADAEKIKHLLQQGRTNEAQTLLAALILSTDQEEYHIALSLTPSPFPTVTPTITPTPIPPYQPDGTSYSAKTLSTERGAFSVKVITVDIDKYNIITDTGDTTNCSNNCTTKSLATYIKENDGVTGINGTYFCPPDYAECASKKNSFDFPVYNSRIAKWINPYNLLWNDRAIIFQDEKGLQFRNSTKSVKEYDYYYEYEGITRHLQTKKYTYYAGFAMAPGLLEGGNVIVDQYPLTEKQKAKGLKAGLGFNNSTIYLVIAYNISMVDFGYVFKTLGATYAINLDAGGSTAMWYGNYKAGPGRSLPNAIVFVKK